VEKNLFRLTSKIQLGFASSVFDQKYLEPPTVPVQRRSPLERGEKMLFEREKKLGSSSRTKAEQSKKKKKKEQELQTWTSVASCAATVLPDDSATSLDSEAAIKIFDCISSSSEALYFDPELALLPQKASESPQALKIIKQRSTR
jgi:hypothetical protein